MKINEAILNEELKVQTGSNALNKMFREYINQVFSSTYLKKIDRTLNGTLLLKTFNKNNNMMAYTSGTSIYINTSKFLNLADDRCMVYIIHEFFHCLGNLKSFPEINIINKKLDKAAEKYIPKDKMNIFLTGKDQDIHSDFHGEFLSYMSNNAFNWSLAPELKSQFKNIIESAGIFNTNSKWWRERLS